MGLPLIDLHYMQTSFTLLWRRTKFESEGKISLLVTLIQRFLTQSKLPLIFIKTILFPHKTAYFSYNSRNAYKNADDNSKCNITTLNHRKLTFWKQPGMAKDEIKVSVILANKFDVKAKNFIIPISFYGNQLVVTRRLFPFLFLFLSSSKTFSRHLKNHKWHIKNDILVSRRYSAAINSKRQVEVRCN